MFWECVPNVPQPGNRHSGSSRFATQHVHRAGPGPMQDFSSCMAVVTAMRRADGNAFITPEPCLGHPPGYPVLLRLVVCFALRRELSLCGVGSPPLTKQENGEHTHRGWRRGVAVQGMTCWSVALEPLSEGPFVVASKSVTLNFWPARARPRARAP